tara:strand:- start:5521 stop:6549 length:1029 start_codon:yes stop_codon:yes gene_type:complete
MPKFIGNRIGDTVPNAPGVVASSAVYNMDDVYWMKQEGGYENYTLPMIASGGSEYTPGNGFKYHKFTSPGSLVVTRTGVCDLLVVAGGGGGGSYYGAGGGAGGVAFGDDVTFVSTGTYGVEVGGGGSKGGVGGDGSNSYIGSPGSQIITNQPDYILAKGGGGGGNAYATANGRSGGSGGGDSGGNSPPFGGLATQPNTNPSPQVSDYGFPGGWSYPTGGYAPAGGGGAGAQGVNIPAEISGGGNGGAGVPISGFEYPLIGWSPYDPTSPTNNHFGGGGGAGIYSSATGDRSGLGGHGGGGGVSDGAPNYAGLGGGGNGTHSGSGSSQPGTGGSGCVIIRYAV